MTERLLLTVNEAAVALGLGRSFVWGMVMRGDLPSVKLGRARRIPALALDEYVVRLTEQNSAKEAVTTKP